MGYIVIDKDKCKNCGICMAVCPNKLIRQSSDTNKQGSLTAEFYDENNKCTGCSLCAVSCPDIAIKEVVR